MAAEFEDYISLLGVNRYQWLQGSRGCLWRTVRGQCYVRYDSDAGPEGGPRWIIAWNSCGCKMILSDNEGINSTKNLDLGL